MSLLEPLAALGSKLQTTSYTLSRGSFALGLAIGVYLSYTVWRKDQIPNKSMTEFQDTIDEARRVMEELDRMASAPDHAPKVFIISMSEAEADTWLCRQNGFESTPELPLDRSPGSIHHSRNGDICHTTIGMGLINAALAMSAILTTPGFDFSKTYFLIAGIAGVNPKVGSLGSVVLAKYVVQVDLQYELDAREIQAGWKSGYFPQGSASPDKPPKTWYGTEVFELNANLREKAVEFARRGTLIDSDVVKKYCSRYLDEPGAVFKAARLPPSVIKADVASSNVFFHGRLLSEAFSQTCQTFTNGGASYGVTAQEDSAILAALLRGAVTNQVNFSRIILLRAASNFDQPPAGEQPEIPLHKGHGGSLLALENIYLAGGQILTGILNGWDETFDEGIPAENYTGDILGSLGGVPDFGPKPNQVPV